MQRLLIVLLLLTLSFPLAASADRTADMLLVGNFSSGLLDGWQSKEFSGQTDYRLVEQQGRTVLAAEANNAASGLFREVEIDLSRTPYLNWEWRLEKAHPPLAETTRDGDDYGARLYVVVSGGLLFWKTRALNYVWTSSQEKDALWPNAFAGKNAMLLAIRSSDDATGVWYREKRNVLDDLKRAFGEEILRIDAVAVMTDSDNAHGSAKALYGDISFTAD
ncbi:MAG: hypothetical protein C0618_01320 [Desulfuromonas sp.]|nr:MAG: hypothetical protein C0618_01320 [Desulfuromonas sp.]